MAPSTASGQPLLEALAQGVHSLSTRTPEVHKAQKNLQTGELVPIADYSVPRHQWPIELVTDAFPDGPDGLVMECRGEGHRVNIQKANYEGLFAGRIRFWRSSVN